MKTIRVLSVGGLLVGLLAALLHIAPSHAAPAPLPTSLAQAVEIKLTASDADSRDDFGFDVALDGDTAIVGARDKDNERGAAYIFVRTASGWAEQAKLVAPDSSSGDNFGSTVALQGDTALITALQDVGEAPDRKGSVYVFVRSGTTWSLQQKLTSDLANSYNFGSDLALEDDLALVRVMTRRPSDGWYQSMVSVFERTGTTWSEQTRLMAIDNGIYDGFGSSIALQGNIAIVGSLLSDTTAGENAGAAYVFARSGNSWTQQQLLSPLDSAAGDRFGSALVLEGDTAIIGAYGVDSPSGSDHGSAYVFSKIGDTWTEQQKLDVEHTGGGDDEAFGTHLALDGDTLLVGLASDYAPNGTRAGSVAVFKRSGGSWTYEHKLYASDGAKYDYFGEALAASGGRVLVGARNGDAPSAQGGGAAYVYEPAAWLLCEGKPATIVGTDAGETLTGTAGDDVLLALGGDDTIEGLGGNDTICAGDGADTVYGGADSDIVYGEAGADLLWGGGGLNADPIADGDDRIDGGADNDIVYGEDGADALFGQDGNDQLYGQSGNDSMEGGNHNDIVHGGAGDDTLRGDAGADTLTGSLGRDRFSGGPDEDTLTDFSQRQGDTRDGT